MQKHILIVDNDTEELRRLREILSREGYNIMTAMDRETALRICKKVTVSFILSSTDFLSLKSSSK